MHRGKRLPVALALIFSSFVLLLVSCASGVEHFRRDRITRIYFLRHAETIGSTPRSQLSRVGRLRAARLITQFQGIPITHIYASQTNRVRHTALPLAQNRGLELLAFRRSVPRGSTAVVFSNGENLFPLLALLGAPVATFGNQCANRGMHCLPCADSFCFPSKEYDNIWLLEIRGKDTKLIRSRY